MLKTITTPATRPPQGNHRPQLTMSIAFINKTGRTITVVWKNGQNAVLHPMLDSNSNGSFTVLITYTFNADTNFNSLPQTFEFSDDERRLYEEALTVGSRKGNSLTVAYQIPYEDLDGCRGAYHDTLDMVFTVKRNEEVPKHPRSDSLARSSLIPSVKMEMINYRIILIDKRGLVGRRYINLGGVVLEVPIETRADMPDGVYIAYSASNVAEAKHYAVDDEKCPIRLWTTYAAAMAQGDELEATKHDYEVRKHKLKMIEIDIAAEKARQEAIHRQEVQKLEEDNKRAEALLDEHEREIEHMRRVRESNYKIREANVKHQYEEQSAVRKNTSEWLKIVPSLVGFVGLAFGMYKSTM